MVEFEPEDDDEPLLESYGEADIDRTLDWLRDIRNRKTTDAARLTRERDEARAQLAEAKAEIEKLKAERDRA